MINKGDKVKTLIQKKFFREHLHNVLEVGSVLTVLENENEEITVDISKYFPYLDDTTLALNIDDVEKTYIKKDDQRIRCPICGKHVFTQPSDYEICPVCWWENDGNTDDIDEFTTIGSTIRKERIKFKKKLIDSNPASSKKKLGLKE